MKTCDESMGNHVFNGSISHIVSTAMACVEPSPECFVFFIAQ